MNKTPSEANVERKPAKKKKYIVFLVSLVIAALINAYLLYQGVGVTIALIIAYPQPIDSFWTMDGSITLSVIAALLLCACIAGIVFCARKLKSR